MGHRTETSCIEDSIARLLKKEIEAMSIDLFFNLIIESEKDVLNGNGVIYEGLKKEIQPLNPSEYN